MLTIQSLKSVKPFWRFITNFDIKCQWSNLSANALGYLSLADICWCGNLYYGSMSASETTAVNWQVTGPNLEIILTQFTTINVSTNKTQTIRTGSYNTSKQSWTPQKVNLTEKGKSTINNNNSNIHKKHVGRLRIVLKLGTQVSRCSLNSSIQQNVFIFWFSFR